MRPPCRTIAVNLSTTARRLDDRPLVGSASTPMARRVIGRVQRDWPRGDPDMSVSDALIRRSSGARRWLGLTATIVIAVTLTAGSASATVVERERVFKNPYEFVAWDCGYPM